MTTVRQQVAADESYRTLLSAGTIDDGGTTKYLSLASRVDPTQTGTDGAQRGGGWRGAEIEVNLTKGAGVTTDNLLIELYRCPDGLSANLATEPEETVTIAPADFVSNAYKRVIIAHWMDAGARGGYGSGMAIKLKSAGTTDEYTATVKARRFR